MTATYRMQTSVLIPLAKGAYDTRSGSDRLLTWKPWEEYIGRTEAVPSLLPNPTSQPWLRVPNSEFPGTFRRHIENFFYPGMAERRQGSERGSGRKIPRNTRRWMGLPQGGEVRLDMDLSRFRNSAIELPALLTISIDAAEVFEADLGPKLDIYGPVAIGIIHFSVAAEATGLDDGPERSSWSHGLFKAVLGLLSSEMTKVNSKSDSSGSDGSSSADSPLQIHHSGSDIPLAASVSKSDYAPLVFPLSWLVHSVGSAPS